GFVIGNEMAHETGDLAAQRRFVDRRHAAILDHSATVDDDGFDAAAGLGIDKLARRAVERQITDIVKIDEDEIRLVAGPDCAQTTAEPGAPRIAEGGMAQDFMRKPGPWLRLADRGDEAEHLHRLKHVLDVAAAAIVAAEP